MIKTAICCFINGKHSICSDKCGLFGPLKPLPHGVIALLKGGDFYEEKTKQA